MKTNALKQLVLIFALSVLPFTIHAKDKTLSRQEATSTNTDSVSYDLVVFEIGYETFLHQQSPMELYSESYYKIWNTFYVSEWNIRYIENKLVGADQDIIHYDPLVEYGIELEYKLYYFFRFYEHKFGVKLLNRAGS